LPAEVRITMGVLSNVTVWPGVTVFVRSMTKAPPVGSLLTMICEGPAVMVALGGGLGTGGLPGGALGEPLGGALGEPLGGLFGGPFGFPLGGLFGDPLGFSLGGLFGLPFWPSFDGISFVGAAM
jgi:hypothetical protein